jgi:ankyrin repeat protein
MHADASASAHPPIMMARRALALLLAAAACCCLAGTASSQEQPLSEAEQILESRRLGPAEDSTAAREAWRAATASDRRLVWAALHGDALEVTTALADGADPDAEESIERGSFDAVVGRFRTALKLAAMRSDHAMIDELLGAGADVNHASRGDRTALMMAVESQEWHEGSVETATTTIKALVAAGADLGLQSEGMTALSLAAAKPEGRAVVGALLELGADLADPMPLILAAHYGNDAIARELLEHGADPDAQAGANGGALLMAASYGKREVVQALIEFGADVDITNEGGRYPLKQAVLQDHVECAQELVDAGVRVDEATIESISQGFPQGTAKDGSRTLDGPPHLLEFIGDLKKGLEAGELPKPRKEPTARANKRRGGGKSARGKGKGKKRSRQKRPDDDKEL